MNTSQQQDDNADFIRHIYDKLAGLFCRDPEFVYRFPVPLEDIPRTHVLHKIYQAALELRDSNRPATMENLAAAGAASIETLYEFDAQVDRRLQMDYEPLFEHVRVLARHNRFLEFLERSKLEAMQTPFHKHDDFFAEWRARSHTFTQPVRESSTSISEILHDMQTEDGANIVSIPIPSGIYEIDLEMGGGARLQEFWVLGGAQKTGKSTIARNIIHYGATVAGRRMAHVAGDGGNRKRQAAYYLGMTAKIIAIRNRIPSNIEGEPGDVFHWRNVAVWLANTNPRRTEKLPFVTSVSPQHHEILIAARDELIQLKQEALLQIVDPVEIGCSPERLVSWIENQVYRNGVEMVLIDHVGKFGDVNRHHQIFDRLSVVVQNISQLISRVPVSVLVLSQRNAEGNRNSGKANFNELEDESWSANLQGGKLLEQEADALWLVGRPIETEDTILLKTKLNRDGPSHQPVVELKVHPPTGLLLENYETWKTVEGYS